MMDLICSADGEVPLWMRIGDENESDCQQFAQIMKDFKSQLNWDSLIVLDSAFYSQENVQSSQSICWLSRQTFACIPDARGAAQKLLKKSKYHHLTNIQIEPVAKKHTTDATTDAYQVRGTVSLCEQKIQPIHACAGRFIIATNVLNEEVLTAEEMLSKYKGQQAVERGFRFLKDPMFLTDSVFLKSPERLSLLKFFPPACQRYYLLS